MRYLRRGSVLFLEFVVLVFVVATVLAGILLWRLTSGPVQIDFLTPYLEESFQGALPGSRARIGRTVLVWEDRSELISLTAEEVQLMGISGEAAVSLPEVEVQLSFRALLRGLITPTEIEITGAHLVLSLSPDGGLAIQQGSDEDQLGPQESDLPVLGLEDWLDRALRDPDLARPLSYLTGFTMVDTRLSFVQHDSGRLIYMQSPLLDIRRRNSRLFVDMAVDLEGSENSTRLGFHALADRASRQIESAIEFDDVRLGDWANSFPSLQALAALDLPLSGSVEFDLDFAGDLQATNFSLTAGPGVVGLPESGLPPYEISSAQAKGSWAMEEQTLAIEDLALGLVAADGAKGPVIAWKGQVQSTGPLLAGDVTITGQASMSTLLVEQMDDFWPKKLVPDARAWVLENIVAGQAKDLTLDLALKIPESAEKSIEVEKISGGFSVEQARIHYLRPLPPVEGIDATALFDHDTLSFSINAAHQGALQVADGTLIISNLSTYDIEKGIYEEIYLDLGVQSPVKDAFALLEHPHLDLLSDMGIQSEGSGGLAATRLIIRFPLLLDLGLDDVDISANATIESLTLPSFWDTANVSEGSVQLAVDKAGMQTTGQVNWGGTRMQLDWRESFQETAETKTLVKALIPRIDGQGLASLGVNPAPYLEGPLAATAVMSLPPTGPGTLKIAANLKDAAVALPELEWSKAAGIDGALKVTLAMESGRVTSFAGLELAAGDLTVTGSGAMDAQGSLAQMTLSNIALQDHRIDEALVRFEADGGVSIAVQGGDINAARFLYGDEEQGLRDRGGLADEEVRQPFTLSAKGLRRLRFGDGRWLENAELHLEQKADGWHRLFVDAGLPQEGGGQTGDGEDLNKERVRLNFGPAQSGEGFGLTLQSGNTGGVMQALDLIDTLKGGEIRVRGQADGPLPNHILRAEIDMRDFRLVDAPLMVSLLSVASLGGSLDLLRGDGIAFARMTGEFELLDGVASSELIRIYGSALGLTAKGFIDFDEDYSDIVGTVVPAYAINQVLGEIPLLGTVLTGGEGEGFLAVTYKVVGPLLKPAITVNPLSALAPGFLRGLFTGALGEEENGELSGDGYSTIEALPQNRSNK